MHFNLHGKCITLLSNITWRAVSWDNSRWQMYYILEIGAVSNCISKNTSLYFTVKNCQYVVLSDEYFLHNCQKTFRTEQHFCYLPLNTINMLGICCYKHTKLCPLCVKFHKFIVKLIALGTISCTNFRCMLWTWLSDLHY
jgi:hypothetical protein